MSHCWTSLHGAAQAVGFFRDRNTRPASGSAASGRQPVAGTITGMPNDIAVMTEPEVSTSEKGKTPTSAALKSNCRSSLGKKRGRSHDYPLVGPRYRCRDLLAIFCIVFRTEQEAQMLAGQRSKDFRQVFEPLVAADVAEVEVDEVIVGKPQAAACLGPG